MDELLRRFPDVAQNIFKQLDDKSLANCRKVNKFWSNFIDTSSLLWRKRIQKYSKNQTEFQDDWKLVTTKVSFEKVKELAQTVEEFYKFVREKGQHSPLHIGAAMGNISIFEYIAQRTGMVNVARKDGVTPLHFAAPTGNLEIVRYIAENLEDKNPAMNNGVTPLHIAAKQGHLEIVRYIAENLEDKNPTMDDGMTPLHVAAKKGHLEIVKYIAGHVEEKNPSNQNGHTPISYAQENNHLEIVDYLSKTFSKRSHVDDAKKSPKNDKRRKL